MTIVCGSLVRFCQHTMSPETTSCGWGSNVAAPAGPEMTTVNSAMTGLLSLSSETGAEGHAERARSLVREIVERLAEGRRELVIHALDRLRFRGIERLQRRRRRGGADRRAELCWIGDRVVVEDVQDVG